MQNRALLAGVLRTVRRWPDPGSRLRHEFDAQVALPCRTCICNSGGGAGREFRIHRGYGYGYSAAAAAVGNRGRSRSRSAKLHHRVLLLLRQFLSGRTGVQSSRLELETGWQSSSAYASPRADTTFSTMARAGSSAATRFCVAAAQQKLCQWGRVTVPIHADGTANYIFTRSASTANIFNYRDQNQCGADGGGLLKNSLFRQRQIFKQSTTATVAGTFPNNVSTKITAGVPEAISRNLATMRTQQPGSLPEYQVDPYTLLEDDLKDVYGYIRQALRRNTYQEELHEIATYYFDGQGKAIRPMVAILMARAINYHLYKKNTSLLTSQREVAMISEMIHTASLVHDDVIDQSDFRRGKPSVNVMWNHKKVTMAGDFILAVASMMIARLRNNEVTLVLSQVVTDLVQGEFMQLGSKETENERFAHYLTKTYRKTASLIANAVKAVAMLAGADEELSELSYQYGRNLGLAFQLVDDLLDFVSSSATMGKPTAADLKLGLATAPVLFACEKYPELNPMIMRRFQEPGDVEKAFELVHKSQGLEQTQFLARQHCQEAVRIANLLKESPYQKGLIVAADYVLNRMK